MMENDFVKKEATTVEVQTCATALSQFGHIGNNTICIQYEKDFIRNTTTCYPGEFS
jgi:hypothetical protein